MTPMSGLSETYPLVLTQKVIWGDMDAFQHLNNTVYFRYFEDVRMAFFDNAGVIEHLDKTGIGPILASTRCDFLAPLTYPDEIEVAAHAVDLQSRRFTLKYVVFSRLLDRVAAEGESLIVFYDYSKKRSCEIPEFIAASVRALQPAL